MPRHHPQSDCQRPTALTQTQVIASALLVAAAPVATWWLVGDLSEPVVDPDYMFRPLPMPRVVEHALGFVAILLVVAAGFVLGRDLKRRRLDRAWLPSIVFLAVAGTIVGFGWRILTAGVIGANIGGGLVMLFGGPLVVVMVVSAMVMAYQAARRDPRR